MKLSPQLASLENAAPEVLEFALLNQFQRGFPLLPRPFAVVAAQLGLSERCVIETFQNLQTRGMISRIGAIFQPNVVGVSALAALAVPPARLDEVARYVSACKAVNHNYEREHHYNLWFVVTASDADSLQTVLQDIEHACACGAVLVLPMLQDYHIDLGFDLASCTHGSFRDADVAPACSSRRSATGSTARTPIALSKEERALIAALQDGLPLIERPFAALGCSEATAIATLARWLDDGVIKRFGVVVRHLELGFTDNAMVVWDVPDSEVDEVGRRIAHSGQVTLCYRRPRQLPDWPYSLFCMMHGKDRAQVEARIVALAQACSLNDYPRAVLFSRRRFKQRGAHYAASMEIANG